MTSTWSGAARCAVREQQSDITFQGWLIAFGREMAMGLLLDNIRRHGTLGEQRIGRDVLARNVTSIEQRNRHTDLDGLAYLRQCARVVMVRHLRLTACLFAPFHRA